jgi:hypothetical protein
MTDHMKHTALHYTQLNSSVVHLSACLYDARYAAIAAVATASASCMSAAVAMSLHLLTAKQQAIEG